MKTAPRPRVEFVVMSNNPVLFRPAPAAATPGSIEVIHLSPDDATPCPKAEQDDKHMCSFYALWLACECHGSIF